MWCHVAYRGVTKIICSFWQFVHEHRLISDVRPHVKHTDFATTGDYCSAFRVVLMSSDLWPSVAADVRDMFRANEYTVERRPTMELRRRGTWGCKRRAGALCLAARGVTTLIWTCSVFDYPILLEFKNIYFKYLLVSKKC